MLISAANSENLWFLKCYLALVAAIVVVDVIIVVVVIIIVVVVVIIVVVAAAWFENPGCDINWSML